ncbi:MAG: NAD(P)-dependent oxidoreductase [Alphaproteobacteria bacterium]|nr:NAD(P)-dependent oxidoreductase [Alphaproteobacteria bacterium]TAD91889.1 MAG: NAD(P)-dependent oxidoreductase [Alphaproteobacteria bacterium]
MSVLITGGTGFIGMNVAEALAAQGERVVLLSLEPPPPHAPAMAARLPGQIAAIQGDVRDQATVEALMAEADVDRVVHAAVVTAGPQRERRDPKQILDINLMGTLSVLEAAQRRPIRRVVLLSSVAVFGQAGFVSQPLDEEAPVRPDGLYSITKYAAERTGLRIKQLSGLDVVAARLGAVFGPWERDTGLRDTLSPPYQCLVHAIEGREAVLPRPGLRDWVYARDVADGIVRLLNAPKLDHGVYHIGSGFRWTLEDWCSRLARRYPGFAWRLSADPAEMTVDLFSTTDRAPLLIDRLVAETGFRPRFDLDAAFADFMTWLDT